MLILLDEQKNNIHIFHQYSGLHNFIETQEKQRNGRRAKWKAHPWVFACHSHRRMMAYQGISRNLPADAASKDTNGWDVLEMVSGNPDNPVFIPLAHNVDVEPLQQNWCKKYCDAHGYTLVEVDDMLKLKKLAGSLENGKRD